MSRRARVATLALLAVLSAAAAHAADPEYLAEMHWRMIGPFRGGRTVGASGVRGKPNLFYVGVNNGGVWKTDDAGRTWMPVFDAQPTQSIGALAVAPSDPNVIYVGSGEGLQRPDLSVGDGMYRSADGGQTWKHLGLSDGRQIGAILVDPGDANRLFVAVLGHPYGPNAERGVFRSTDGGATFEKVLYRDENTGAIDLAFDPSNPHTVYAVLWAARQGPWEYENSYKGPGSGLFRSTDGGTKWEPIGKGLPTAAEGLSRIGIGIAPSDRRRVYALVEASAARGGLYRSDDAGNTFTRVNGDERIWGRGDDFACVRVHPKNPDELFVANIAAYRSKDGGRTFTSFKGAPGGDDYHTIWLNPDDPDVMLLAVDQGATVSVNGGRTWSSWYNQPTGQMFHVTADNRFPYWVYGGQQESGSAGVASRGNDGQITFRDWHPVGVEEYGYAAPDPLHPGIIYGGKVTRYDEKTGMTQEVGPVVLRTGKYRFVRTAPILFSPTDPHVLYFALNVLFRTANGGESWDVISPDLTREDPGVPANLGVYAEKAKAPRGVIYAIGPSPKDGGTIWAGTDDGYVQVTRDGGRSWKNVTPPDMTPWSKVTQIDASHFDAGTAYVSVSRFRLDDLAPYVYRTKDGGATWKKITAGLAGDAPVNVVREDPERAGLLFAGTERGVSVSFDDGESWQSLRGNLPASSVRDLVVKDGDLVVATHGRSFWILDDISRLRQWSVDGAPPASVRLFRPRRAYRLRRNQNTDTPLPPEEPAGENPPDGAILDYRLATAPAAPVTLEVRDAAGRVIRRYSSADKLAPPDPSAYPVPAYWFQPPEVLSAAAGTHRFVWDLREETPAVLRRSFPISAIAGDTPLVPEGPLVPPGTYTVTLSANGASSTQTLAVEMDPRVPATASDLAKQSEAARGITAALARDSAALEEVRAARARIAKSARTEKTAALDAALAELEEGKEAAGGDLSTEGFRRLNARLGTLLEVVESADAAPTEQASAALTETLRVLDDKLARWKTLRPKGLRG
ncbi:MAG TPA: glycoside hydrolase [Thermoanaerobaculia bacterium]